MSDTTPRLKLPFMSTAQVQKELTFNELAAMVDALMHLAVIDLNLMAPPAAPAEGDTYIIPVNGTGLWAGRAQQIAYYVGGWHYLEAQEGWLAFVKDEHKFYRFDENAWEPTVVTAIEKFVELTDVAISPAPERNGYVVTYDSAIGKFVLQPVAAKLADLKDVDLTGLADNGVIVWDVETAKFHTMQLPAPGSTTFTGLSDTPDALKGAEGKGIRVNAAGDALEYFTIPAAGAKAFTGLSDTPGAYNGQAGRGLRVNADATGLEFYDTATGGGFEDAPDDGKQYARQNGGWSVVVAGGGGGGDDGPSTDPVTYGKHRFWRVAALGSVHQSYVAIAQITFSDKLDGDFLATPGPFLTSGNYDAVNHTAKDAFDAAANTYWESTNGNPTNGSLWVGHDFGTSPVDVVRFAYMASDAEADEAPTSLAVEYSDNGSAWTRAWVQAVNSPNGTLSPYFSPDYNPVVPVYVQEAPADGKTYGRKDGDWAEIVAGSGGGDPVTDPVSQYGEHTYWAINVSSTNNAGYAGWAECAMLDKPGGSNQCVGGVAASNTSVVAGTVANGFDGDPTTTFASGGVASRISYQFLAPVNVQEIDITAWPSRPNEAPVNFVVQYSDDGVAWSNAWVVGGTADWTAGEKRKFVDPTLVIPDVYVKEAPKDDKLYGRSNGDWKSFSPGEATNVEGGEISSYPSARDWRVLIKDGGYRVLTGVEFRPIKGASVIPTEGVASSSDNYSGEFPAANAFDGNNTTIWHSGRDVVPHWVAYRHTKPIVVREVLLQARNSGQANDQGVFNFDVQYSLDGGSTWQTFFSRANEPGWAQSEIRLYTNPEPETVIHKIPDTPADLGATEEAPKNISAYARRNGAWTKAVALADPASPPVIRQKAFRRDGGALNLPADAVIGNTLVLMCSSHPGTNPRVGGAAPEASGFTLVTAPQAPNQQVWVWTIVVSDGNKGAARQVDMGSNGQWAIYELEKGFQQGRIVANINNTSPVLTDGPIGGMFIFGFEHDNADLIAVGTPGLDGVVLDYTVPAGTGGNHFGAFGHTVNGFGQQIVFAAGLAESAFAAVEFTVSAKDNTPRRKLADLDDIPDSFVGFSGALVGIKQDGSGAELLKVNEDGAVPTPHGRHKFWRIVMTGSFYNAYACGEMNFLTDPNAPVIDRTGVVASTNSGGNPALMLDGNPNTYVDSNGATQNTTWTFTFPTPQGISSFIYTPRPDQKDQFPRVYQIQFSDDNNAWVDAWNGAVAGSPYASGNPVRFDSPLIANLPTPILIPRYLDAMKDVTAPAPAEGEVLTWDEDASQWVPRLPAMDATRIQAVAPGWRVRSLGSAMSGTSVGFGEISFMSGGDALSLVGGTPVASSVYDASVTYQAANAFDGNPATAWYSAQGTTFGAAIGYKFAGAVAPDQVKITADANFPKGGTVSFAVDYQLEDGSWQQVALFVALPWDANQVQTFNIPKINAVISSSGGDGSFEEPPANGRLFARMAGDWVALPEEVKDYVSPFPNVRQLDYMNMGAGFALPFTPKVGNYLVLFVGTNNGHAPTAGWTETRNFGYDWFSRISFVYKIVDQAMIDAAFLQPVTAGDAGVLFELDARYVADPLDPLGGVFLTTGGIQTNGSAGVYTPTADTAYLYGGVAREGDWAETNADAVAPSEIRQNSGNRTGGAGYLATVASGVTEDLTFSLNGGSSCGYFALGATLVENGPVDPIEDAPDDGAIYGRRGNQWVAISTDLPDAPQDGKHYVRRDGEWLETLRVVQMTQAQYDALTAKDPNTFYGIVG